LPYGTAQGYIPAGHGEWRTNIYAIPVIGGGDGGAFTNAPDLARFWDALLGYELLSQRTVARMLTPHWRTKPGTDDTHYGYGIWLKQGPGEPVAYYMLGGDPGVVFYSGYYPVSQVQFTLLANTDDDSATTMFDCIAPLLRAA
jgi:CubicO group peptidase (beta-lactamase class C family)